MKKKHTSLLSLTLAFSLVCNVGVSAFAASPEAEETQSGASASYVANSIYPDPPLDKPAKATGLLYSDDTFLRKDGTLWDLYLNDAEAPAAKQIADGIERYVADCIYPGWYSYSKAFVEGGIWINPGKKGQELMLDGAVETNGWYALFEDGTLKDIRREYGEDYNHSHMAPDEDHFVEDVKNWVTILLYPDANTIAGQGMLTAALKKDGTLWAKDENQGKLGFIEIEIPANKEIKQLSDGGVLCKDGTFYTFQREEADASLSLKEMDTGVDSLMGVCYIKDNSTYSLHFEGSGGSYLLNVKHLFNGAPVETRVINSDVSLIVSRDNTLYNNYGVQLSNDGTFDRFADYLDIDFAADKTNQYGGFMFLDKNNQKYAIKGYGHNMTVEPLEDVQQSWFYSLKKSEDPDNTLFYISSDEFTIPILTHTKQFMNRWALRTDGSIWSLSYDSETAPVKAVFENDTPTPPDPDKDFEIKNDVLISYNGPGGDVTIPDNVVEIGEWAFQDSAVTSVTIPGTVKKIDYAAFRRCEDLEEAILEEGVEFIEAEAFDSCSNLTILNIPASVTDIATNEDYNIGAPFPYCSSLESITVAKNNPNYQSIDGVLFTKPTDGNEEIQLIQYPAGKEEDSYTVPTYVYGIDHEAFAGSANLNQILFPDDLRCTIGIEAFAGCTGLTEVSIPQQVVCSSQLPFLNCSNLKQITVAEGNLDCESVDGVLYGKISHEDGTVDHYLVQYPEAREGDTFTLPANITDTIYGGGMSNNPFLKSIEAAPENPAFASIDGILFSKDGKTLVQCPGGKELGSYTVPMDVTKLEGYCFRNCETLKEITIPSKDTQLDSSAFEGCNNLKTIYGVTGSNAQQTARMLGITFKSIGGGSSGGGGGSGGSSHSSSTTGTGAAAVTPAPTVSNTTVPATSYRLDTTSYSFNAGGVYHFLVKTSSATVPTVTSSAPGLVSVAFGKKTDEGYIFTITGLAAGTATITTQIGNEVASFPVTVGSGSVRSDTTHAFSLKAGSAYTFLFTAAKPELIPQFTAGNGGILKTHLAKRDGNRYYLTVYAVGKPGEKTGVYSQVPGEAAQCHCVVTVG